MYFYTYICTYKCMLLHVDSTQTFPGMPGPGDLTLATFRMASLARPLPPYPCPIPPQAHLSFQTSRSMHTLLPLPDTFHPTKAPIDFDELICFSRLNLDVNFGTFSLNLPDHLLAYAMAPCSPLLYSACTDCRNRLLALLLVGDPSPASRWLAS